MAQADYSARYKDPGSIEDFTVDWTNYLTPNNDALDSVEVIIFPDASQSVSPLLVDTSGNGSYIADSTNFPKVLSVSWLKGGDKNKSYVVTHKVTTLGGRTAEQSFRIMVQDR